MSAVVNHKSGFDDYLEGHKWLEPKDIPGSTTSERIINIRWGLFYSEWNSFLRLQYESWGVKKHKDFKLPNEQYLRGSYLPEGLFLDGYYPDETKHFQFCIDTSDLAKYANLAKRRKMLKQQVITLELPKKQKTLKKIEEKDSDFFDAYGLSEEDDHDDFFNDDDKHDKNTLPARPYRAPKTVPVW